MNIVERFFLRSLSILSSLFGKPGLFLSGVVFGRNLTLYGLPILSRFSGSTIKLGDRVVLCSSSRATALGINHPVVLRTLAPGAKIEIGDDVGMSGGSICAGTGVTIGARCMIGANVTITDTDFHDLSKLDRRYLENPIERCQPVVIGENTFLGTGVIILKGVTIGRNSVIGAGSLVTSDIPENVFASGNPCKLIKEFQPIPDADQK